MPFQPVLEPQPLLLVPPLLPPDDQGRPVRFVQARVQEALDLEGEAETACSLCVEPGDPVAKGQLIGQLGPGPADRTTSSSGSAPRP